jgi:hypothetical protein
MISWKTPTLALATPTSHSPNGYFAKAGLIPSLMPSSYPAQLVFANRANRRRQISLFLARFFQRNSLQLSSLLENLLLQMAHILFAGIDNPD